MITIHELKAQLARLEAEHDAIYKELVPLAQADANGCIWWRDVDFAWWLGADVDTVRQRIVDSLHDFPVDDACAVALLGTKEILTLMEAKSPRVCELDFVAAKDFNNNIPPHRIGRIDKQAPRSSRRNRKGSSIMDQSFSLSYRQENILFLLARQPLSSCSTFSLPIPEICQRGKVTRAEVIAAVGRQSEVHDWRITVDLPTDRVLYQRTSRDVTDPIVRIPYPKAAPAAAPPAPRTIDPQIVGANAREYQEAELKAGRVISTTQAVAHIIGKRT